MRHSRNRGSKKSPITGSATTKGSKTLGGSARETAGRSVIPGKSQVSPSQPRKSERLDKNSRRDPSSRQKSDSLEMPPNINGKYLQSSSMSNAKGKRVRVEANTLEDGQRRRRIMDAKCYRALFLKQKLESSADELSEEHKVLEKLLPDDHHAIGNREAEEKHHSTDTQNVNKPLRKSEKSVEDPDLSKGITPDAQRKGVIIMDQEEFGKENVNCEVSPSKCEPNVLELDSSEVDVSSSQCKEGPTECDGEIHTSVVVASSPLPSHDNRDLTSHFERNMVEEDAESQFKPVTATTITIKNTLCVDIDIGDDEENVHSKDADDPERCDAARDSNQALAPDSACIIPNGNETNDLSGKSASSPRRHRFAEFWVPARLSNVQLELYCSALLSNSMSLSAKSDPVGALSSLLVTLRQTCSHPFLVDRNLSISLVKDVKETEYLDIGIKASGKLQLLDVMLLEMRRRGMRILVVYESIDGRDRMGDILDDFLRQRYGQDSYERVGRGVIIPSKKQEALNKFNNKESGRFVFLLETHACLPSVKLSSVDAIIIYNSDLNPANDIRALQKIVIDSQHDQITVFRLFLPQTVEENSIILAKHNVNGVHAISQSNKDKLLRIGASNLFDELEKFHGVGAPVSTAISSLESSLLQDVVQDLMTQYLQNERQIGDGFSVFLKVQHHHGKYHLVSDQLKTPLAVEKWSSDYWSKLLDGRNPLWKYVSNSDRRNRKRVQCDESGVVLSNKTEDVTKRRRKIVHENTNITFAVESHRLIESDKGSDCDEHLSQSSYCSDRNNIAEDVHSPSDLANNTAAESANMLEDSNRVQDTQKGLLLMLKPELWKLCELLEMSEDAKNLAARFLEYVLGNHHVSRERVTVLQAVQLSVCWIAASLLKQQISVSESLVLAKEHLNFCCSEDDADYVYLKMGLFKELFIQSILDDKANDLACDTASRVFDSEKLMVKIIKQINKKCRKRFETLKQRQHKEMEELKKCSDEEKAHLEQGHKVEVAVVRSIHVHNPLVAANKLKALEDRYSKKLEEHRISSNNRIKSLEDKHSSEKDKENELSSRWKEDIVKEHLEILRKLPQSDFGNSTQKSNSNEQMVRDGPKDDCLLESREIQKSQSDVLGGRVEAATHIDLTFDMEVPEASTHNTGDGKTMAFPTDSNQLPPSTEEDIVKEHLEILRKLPQGDFGNSTQKLNSNEQLTVCDGPKDGCLLESREIQKSQPDVLGGRVEAATHIDLTSDMEVPEASTHNTGDGKTMAFPTDSNQLSPSTDLIYGSGLLSAPTINVPQSQSSDTAAGIPQDTEAPSTDPTVALPHSSSGLNEEVVNTLPVECPSLQADNGLPTMQLNVEVPATEGQPELPHFTTMASSEPANSNLQLDQSFPHTPTGNSHGEPSAAEQLNQLPHSPLGTSFSTHVNSNQPLLATQQSQGISSAPNADTPYLPGPTVMPETSEFTYCFVPSATVSPRVPLNLDPLQGELERIQNEADHIIKIYEDLKRQLNSECGKEIEELVAQIRKKYEAKNLELDAAFTCKKKEFDSYHKKVYMNKMLAEAFRRKCMDLKVSAPPPPAMLQGNLQRQMPRHSVESALQSVVNAPSAVQTSGSLPAAHNSIHLRGLSAQSPSSTAPTSTTRNPLTTQSIRHPSGPAAGNTQNTPRPGIPATPSRFSSGQSSGYPQITCIPLRVGVTTGTSASTSAGQYVTSRDSMGTAPATQPTVSRPVQIVNNASALFPSNSSRPASITSTSQPTLNLHSMSGLRAPPPHLRFRASQPMTSIATSSACHPIPSSRPQYSSIPLTEPSTFMTNRLDLQRDDTVTTPYPPNPTDLSSGRPPTSHQSTLPDNTGSTRNVNPASASASNRSEFVCLSDDE